MKNTVIEVNGMRYRVKRMVAEAAVDEDMAARVTAARLTGQANPLFPPLARRLAEALVREPGALTLEQMPDPVRFTHRARVAVDVLVKE